MKAYNQMFLLLTIITIGTYGCSKSDTSKPNTQDNNLQKQIVNTKWYYDSAVVWDDVEGFATEHSYDPKTYLYFSSDSIMTEFDWNGISYDKTDYPYVFNGDTIKCNYFEFQFNDVAFIKGNQLIFGSVPTLPQNTDLTNRQSLSWDFYHK